MNLISSTPSRHCVVPVLLTARIEINYSNPKCNQVDMLRSMGMCVHIASIHSENLSENWSFHYIRDQSGKQKTPTQVESCCKGAFW